MAGKASRFRRRQERAAGRVGGFGRRRPRPPKPPLRERIASHERPGTITKGPPLTLSCDCGATNKVAYGEIWTCSDCKRTWDTNDIPSDQYALIRRTQLRFRIFPVIVGMLVGTIALLFLATGNGFSVMFLLPLGLLSWFVILRPGHRRRYREAIAALPSWKLHPR